MALPKLDVTLNRWKGERVVVLGLARQGKALARYLTGEGAMVVMSDLKTSDQLQAVFTELADLELDYELGGHPLELLQGTRALFLSGAVPADLPIALEARARGIPLLNDAQLFLERCPAAVIGITGSAGKTTTASLVYQMACVGSESSDRQAWLGGNIGRPLLDDLKNIKAQDLVVMELSSFQLELMTISPKIAGLLNLTPDHLDRHGSMQAYIDAKAHILSYQDEKSTAVIGSDDPRAWDLRERTRGRVIAFGLKKPWDGDAAFVDGEALVLQLDGQLHLICQIGELTLRGPHNVLNVLAACAMGSAVEIPVEAMSAVARSFRGVPHRLEFVRNTLGADWYNDSIATTPDRALAAVRSFDEPLVLLLGGHDKQLPWETFGQEVLQSVKAIILFGEAVPKLEAVFQKIRGSAATPAMHAAVNLEQAVQTASRIVQAGDIVLLSPGCTSYDEYPNFEVRGERFRDMVRAL
ncbi:MAG: UDP-N-acetylmuramoyl-L-alanine--D-glutamate ligase [Anaerolineales bacterium]|nr:MAG: UDP-N-acetylmuramoyl-L-alanine--D-glutamate ligase [Anaerolineales bacterium]